MTNHPTLGLQECRQIAEMNLYDIVTSVSKFQDIPEKRQITKRKRS